jgi:6-phosphogluconolactonase
MPEIEVLPDLEALSEAAARRFTALASTAVSKRGAFTLALAGGSTPQRLYARLGKAPFTHQVPWQKVHFFWGDERCVPPEHPDSNFRMVQQTLLSRVPVPIENIHRMPGELPPLQGAAQYESTLKNFFSFQALPRFDLVLLGLGEDGHTASLFPGSPALSEQERWVVAVEHTTPPPPLVSRLTLTLPVLNSARQVIFLAAGQAKAGRLRQVLQGEGHSLPAGQVSPPQGQVLWLVDREAGSLV